jgi:hypothetical protein
MKLVVLQPGYLPWLGFFDQMHWADTFVIYDDVQYTKNDWRNRNRIKGTNGPQWLTVPVSFHIGNLIKDVALPVDKRWVKSHVKSLQFAYAKARYFDDYFPRIKELIEAPHERLIDLDMALIMYLKSTLGIDTQILYSSRMDAEDSKSQRLINICRECAATQYLTGDAARDYLDVKLFEDNGIEVKYHHYKHPEYPQLFGDFVPYLSVVDILFNCGPESMGYLTKRKSMV